MACVITDQNEAPIAVSTIKIGLLATDQTGMVLETTINKEPGMKSVSQLQAGLLHSFFTVFAICLCVLIVSPAFAAAKTAATEADALTPGQSVTKQSATQYSHEEKQELADHALHILGGNANVISRWMGEIRLALVANTSAQMEQHVKDLVSDISELTGLQGRVLEYPEVSPQDYVAMVQDSPSYDLSVCNPATGTDCANLVVVISDIETVRKLSSAIPLRQVYQRSVAGDSKPYCFFAPFINGRMDIKQSFVFVREDLSDAMTRTCLQEEIFQTFGLFNDASGSDWFSFNNRVEPKSITEMDKLLLQTLYSSELGAGAPAYTVVRKFLQKLDPG